MTDGKERGNFGDAGLEAKKLLNRIKKEQIAWTRNGSNWVGTGTG
jgi:hypothetical protein